MIITILSTDEPTTSKWQSRSSLSPNYSTRNCFLQSCVWLPSQRGSNSRCIQKCSDQQENDSGRLLLLRNAINCWATLTSALLPSPSTDRERPDSKFFMSIYHKCTAALYECQTLGGHVRRLWQRKINKPLPTHPPRYWHSWGMTVHEHNCITQSHRRHIWEK